MELNYPAIFVAALSTFLIGGVWYSPVLFHRAWMRAAGVGEADLARGSTIGIFGLALPSVLTMAFQAASSGTPRSSIGTLTM